MHGVSESATNIFASKDGAVPRQRMASATSRALPPSQTERKKPGFITTAQDEITYRLIGLAMEVHNDLGLGHREEAYHNALAAKQ